MPNEQLASLQSIQDRLTSGPGEDIHFERIEGHGLDGHESLRLRPVDRLHGPGNQKFPEKEQYALIFIKGTTIKGKTQWWVESRNSPTTRQLRPPGKSQRTAGMATPTDV